MSKIVAQGLSTSYFVYNRITNPFIRLLHRNQSQLYTMKTNTLLIENIIFSLRYTVSYKDTYKSMKKC